MKKGLNEKQEKEAYFIKEWCITVIDFIYTKFNVDKSSTEMHKEVFGEETKRRYLRELSPSMYIKGLRMAFDDTNEMAMDGPLEMQEELNKILRDKFGKDIMTYSKKVSKKIKEIKDKGKIDNQDDYRLVMRYADSIYNDNLKRDELTLLNKLLLTWGEK